VSPTSGRRPRDAAPPVEPLPACRRPLAALAEHYDLVLITKGDLLHQEQKLAAPLGDLFKGVEIVSEKTPRLRAHLWPPRRARPTRRWPAFPALDVLPALQPAPTPPHPLRGHLAHEMADPPTGHPRFASSLHSRTPAWVKGLRNGDADGAAAAAVALAAAASASRPSGPPSRRPAQRRSRAPRRPHGRRGRRAAWDSRAPRSFRSAGARSRARASGLQAIDQPFQPGDHIAPGVSPSPR